VSTGWKIALGVGAAVVAVNVALGVLDEVTGGTPGGPRSSSYATGADGAAAYADLLRRDGRRVFRVRARPSEAVLEPTSTAVLLDPPFVLQEDAAALRGFVRSGGRLVAGGARAVRVLETVLGDELEWTDEGAHRPRVLAPAPELAGVQDVSSTGGAWSDSGGALPVLGSRKGALLAVATVARGRVVAFADTSPVRNAALADGDNAQLALGLAGPSGRTVRFLESYHGYGETTGIAAVPDRWVASLALGLVAAAAFVLARGRRLGPPDPETRELAPARRVYVDSLAAVLARARRPEEAAEPVRERARRLYDEASRPGLSGSDSARALGLSEEEVAAIRGETSGTAGVLAAGRALARLERRGRGARR
jgi:hypothetical protein